MTPDERATSVVGRRVGGFIIDAIILWAISTALFFALADQGIPERGADGRKLQPFYDVTVDGETWFVQGGQAWLLMGLVVFVLVDLAVLMQGVIGATPGKLIVGVRVVDADGGRAGFGRNAVRLVGWIVDGFPWFFAWGIVALVTSLASKSHRRVGDMWAGTYVVRAGSVGTAVAVGGTPVPQATAPQGRDAFGNPIVPQDTSPFVAPSDARQSSSPSLWATLDAPQTSTQAPQTSTQAPGAPVPADWYPDPTGEARLRYWDGRAWTNHVAP